MTTPADAAPKAYSPMQIRLHWLVAVLFIPQFLFDDGISRAWRALRSSGVAGYDLATVAHIGAGGLILGFALWRLVLRLRRGVPDLPAGTSPAVRRAAHLGHVGLYAVMIAMPVTGLAAWFGGLAPAAELHEMLKPAIIGLVGLHVLAALWHQFWMKDGLLLRMRMPRT